jgi:hypothetical protein
LDRRKVGDLAAAEDGGTWPVLPHLFRQEPRAASR